MSHLNGQHFFFIFGMLIQMSPERLAVLTDFLWFYSVLRGPGTVVGIATGYRLDDLGIESRWGRDFSHLGPTQPPVQWVPGFSQG